MEIVPVTSEFLAKRISRRPDWYLPLRADIVREVQANRFIKRVAAGQEEAFAACLTSYWPYIGYFGVVIADRLPQNRPTIGRTIGNPETLQMIQDHQAAIRHAEGGHAALWRALAESVGVELPAAHGAECSPAMDGLIETMTAASDAAFYAGLTAIEVVAWALSNLVLRSELRRRPNADLRWFKTHLVPHSPSHEDMYRWIGYELCRTMVVPGVSPRFLFDLRARDALQLFIRVADEVPRTT